MPIGTVIRTPLYRKRFPLPKVILAKREAEVPPRRSESIRALTPKPPPHAERRAMKNSSTKISTELAVGQEVRVEGASQEWMQRLIGRIGTIGAIRRNNKVDAYRVDSLPGGSLWYPAACLSQVEDEDGRRAS